LCFNSFNHTWFIFYGGFNIDNDLMQFKINQEDIIQCNSKHADHIGDIVYQEKFRMWCFIPIENFFYKPVYLALILKKLNELNDYKKGVKHE